MRGRVEPGRQRGRPVGVEGVDGVADRLVGAAERPGDRRDGLAAGAGEHDLAAAQGEGLGRAQAGLQGLALGVRQGTHNERSLHAPECTPWPSILAESALGLVAVNRGRRPGAATRARGLAAPPSAGRGAWAAMARRRSRLRTLLALAVAAAAASAAYLAAGGAADDPAPAGVLVAARDIPAATTLTAELLAVRRVPAGAGAPGALAAVAQAAGRRTAVALADRRAVRETHLAAQPAPPRTAAREVPLGPGAEWLAFAEVHGSGVSGIAALWAAGGGAHVSLQLLGAAVVGGHPAHVHAGTCADFAPDPTGPLTTVVLADVGARGLSETAVPAASLDAWRADDHVILVHTSRDELADYLVCGEINRTVATVPDTGTVATVPNTGTGSSPGSAGGSRRGPSSWPRWRSPLARSRSGAPGPRRAADRPGYPQVTRAPDPSPTPNARSRVGAWTRTRCGGTWGGGGAGAAERRARLHALLGPGVRNLAERVEGVPGGLGDALKGRTRAGWLPAGTVVNAVLGEELTVWYRPRDGRVLAASESAARSRRPPCS